MDKFKNKNNQNCQKIELYVSPTTKELKRKHSLRLVGGVEMGSQGGEDAWQGSGWQTGGQGRSWWTRWSHIWVWINQEEQMGREIDQATQGSSVWK